TATYTQPLPENSTVTITFHTPDDSPAEGVTVSIIACYTPSEATTVITSGTVPPTISGSTPSITISSVITGTTRTPATGLTSVSLATGPAATTTTVICPLTEGMFLFNVKRLRFIAAEGVLQKFGIYRSAERKKRLSELVRNHLAPA
ncbi:unnamed protein product, partial [Adineta ricciae]